MRMWVRGAIAMTMIAGSPGWAQEAPIATSGGPMLNFSGCRYYEHAGFKGWSRDLRQGVRRAYVSDRYNDAISSIACSDDCSIIVYEHRDFQGANREFAGNYNYVGDRWNDRISSARLSCR
ncbi:hypothetical protein [Sandaracinobacteroides saxicola]|uniref:Beta/gamma crystallin 'Greek key' domain-containing protein n=1 Tax=Sandaracinobacteroides saxicola TaxID=2759707 RepID=A0A7G5ILY0_9SPHN|nr:hypothetical protein [Sandaracinobacteroides saxicola]QMW24372.1 hypothetical protein H3309_07950 [Sandaracinobacteroides saxicola]